MTQEVMAAFSEEELFRRFQESQQPPVKLALAIEGYFHRKSRLPEAAKAYREYLGRRTLPAAQSLIAREDTAGLAALAAEGLVTKPMLEELLRYANDRRKPESLVWLLKEKERRYGYEAERFDF